ncbi:DUF6544 family protein [Boseongicola aestuarii]|uniref:Uncharacterized protein n=1 Tax=Boseongicola aestuarii TaxID=1470561 RepID=A0A238IZD0_9RHOB|nr:DUF6544 family protein [Boseongicola aestuarii]SMX23839.1 hypothetical protein BOA8489_01952 [Boseongicola aestuarii]
MKTLLLFSLFLIAVGVLALVVWRQFDHRADRTEMARLIATQPHAPQSFSANLISDLPEPARRYFSYTIATGTPLHTVAEIKMRGQFALGNKQDPKNMPIEAKQILAAPFGLVWKMSGGSGLMRMSGSDSGSWMRFWISGIIPVVRLGGTRDHARSAFGRIIGEAAIWTPAALLPATGTVWEAVDDDTARFTVTFDDITQSVDITVDGEGKPTQVLFQRWSDANPDRVHQLQPFGGVLSEFREFQGFRLPTHVEAGNFFDSEDYFPFFIVDVTSLRFPSP